MNTDRDVVAATLSSGFPGFPRTVDADVPFSTHSLRPRAARSLIIPEFDNPYGGKQVKQKPRRIKRVPIR